jgi:multiple sugar transport system permease protein
MLDRLSLRARRTLTAWTFLALPIAFYVSIRFYPTADALLTSLTDWNIVGPRRFVGLANYRRLLTDPSFWQVMSNTFEYLIVGVVVSLELAFLAYHLDQVRTRPRAPHELLRRPSPPVAMAWVWRWLYQR